MKHKKLLTSVTILGMGHFLYHFDFSIFHFYAIFQNFMPQAFLKKTHTYWVSISVLPHSACQRLLSNEPGVLSAFWKTLSHHQDK